MSKFETINSYINKCDDYLNSDVTSPERLELIEEIESVYHLEIKNFTAGLDYFFPDEAINDDINVYLETDLEKIKEKLVNYRDNLELQNHIHEEEQKLEQLKSSFPNINITATATNSNNTTIKFEQVINQIYQLPDSVLSKEDKTQLEDKLASLNAFSKDKEKRKQKLSSLLKFLADKSADAFIAVLPQLGKLFANSH